MKGNLPRKRIYFPHYFNVSSMVQCIQFLILFFCPGLTINYYLFFLLTLFPRSFEKLGLDYLKKVKPMLSDLNTYLSKVGICKKYD